MCCLFFFSFYESGVGADVVPVISSECNEEEVREGGDGARVDMIIRGLSEKIFASGGWRLSWCRFPILSFVGVLFRRPNPSDSFTRLYDICAHIIQHLLPLARP